MQVIKQQKKENLRPNDVNMEESKNELMDVTAKFKSPSHVSFSQLSFMPSYVDDCDSPTRTPEASIEDVWLHSVDYRRLLNWEAAWQRQVWPRLPGSWEEKQVCSLT